MTEKQITAREKELQSYIRMHPRLNLEFKAMMSRLLREHRIDVTPETLSRLTIALDRSGADKDSEDITIPIPSEKDGISYETLEPSVSGASKSSSDSSKEDLEPDIEPELSNGLEPDAELEKGDIEK